MDVEFKFDEPTEFDLMYSEKFYQGFKNGCEKYFKEKSDKYIANLIGRLSESEKFVLTFKIESDDMNFKDYEFFDPNGKTRALWEKIKEELKKTLPEYVEITLKNWMSVAINKESNEDGIEEKIRQFAE